MESYLEGTNKAYMRVAPSGTGDTDKLFIFFKQKFPKCWFVDSLCITAQLIA